jgi:hypothetical protein
MRTQLQVFLTCAIDETEWTAPLPDRFTGRDKPLRMPWREGGGCEGQDWRTSVLSNPAVRPIASHCTDWARRSRQLCWCTVPLRKGSPISRHLEPVDTGRLKCGTLMGLVRLEVSMAVTIMNVVFWDIRTLFVLHKKHITSPLESSQLMLCKTWDFHGGDYEECRLLGYKNPVRTSQETHYVSATEPTQLMLCKTWGLHGSDYEECRLLRCKNPVRTSQETHYVSTTESSQLMLCKTWDFHGGNYEECRLLRYKNPVRTSWETHYVSATEPTQLMLCKTWSFHGSDYEECRLLRCKNPVRTSQETHYVSATESSRLMLCKIWGFDGGDYEEYRLLGCYSVWLL